MIFTTLDILTRRGLLEDGLPIHYYPEFLFHASTALRELTFDTLKIINSKSILVNEYGAIDLPGDFQDDLAVCIPAGQRLVNIPKQDNISPLRLIDSTDGSFIPYNSSDNTSDDASVQLSGFPFFGFGWYWNIDAYGGFTGRQFGQGGGTTSGYKLFKERRQIQLTEDFIGSNVILLYVSDGQSIDNASQVDVKAFQCIRSFQEWKKSPNANNDNSPEGGAFYNQRRLLRARLDDLTPTDIVNLLRRNYIQAPKS